MSILETRETSEVSLTLGTMTTVTYDNSYNDVQKYEAIEELVANTCKYRDV